MSVPPHHLDLHQETDPSGRAVIFAHGDIDLKTAPTLRLRIEAASTGGQDVVVDLGDVRFVDSPGLGTLIYCHQRQEETGAHLVVRSPQGQVRELFELMALTHLISDE
jgi:anti-sigma B factor antagonist